MTCPAADVAGVRDGGTVAVIGGWRGRHLRWGRPGISELLQDVLEGRIDPGRVFDRTVDLDGVPDGYRAMNDRQAPMVLIRP